MVDDSWAPILNWEFHTEAGLSLDRYMDYWGDEFGWTALLPLAWTSYSAPGFSITPKFNANEDIENTYLAASYWSAAVHLLALGMGWTDIGEGLRRWRENEYPSDHHPILDFVKSVYGEDIRALEVWFGMIQRYRLREILTDLSGKSLGLMEEPIDYSRYLQWEEEYVDLPGERRSLTQRLLNGSDPLHLEDHVASSIQGSGNLGANPWISTGNSSSSKTVTFYRYGGWAVELSKLAELRPDDSSVHAIDQAVSVDIEKIGRLGDFVLHPGSNRWFVFSHTFGVPSLQWDSHLWGNPS